MTLAEARLSLSRGNFLRYLGMWKLELEFRQREQEVAEREQKVEVRESDVEKQEQALQAERDRIAYQGISRWDQEEDLLELVDTPAGNQMEQRGSMALQNITIKDIINEAVEQDKVDEKKLAQRLDSCEKRLKRAREGSELANLKDKNVGRELIKALHERNEVSREEAALQERKSTNQWWVDQLEQMIMGHDESISKSKSREVGPCWWSLA